MLTDDCSHCNTCKSFEEVNTNMLYKYSASRYSCRTVLQTSFGGDFVMGLVFIHSKLNHWLRLIRAAGTFATIITKDFLAGESPTSLYMPPYLYLLAGPAICNHQTAVHRDPEVPIGMLEVLARFDMI